MANHYQTRDGRWFINGTVQRAAAVARVPVGDRTEGLTGDPRFASNESAARYYLPHLVKILDAEFAKRDLDDWRKILDGVGVTFGIVGTVNEVLDDLQMRDSGALVPFCLTAAI